MLRDLLVRMAPLNLFFSIPIFLPSDSCIWLLVWAAAHVDERWRVSAWTHSIRSFIFRRSTDGASLLLRVYPLLRIDRAVRCFASLRVDARVWSNVGAAVIS
jgi:hypothetical protein